MPSGKSLHVTGTPTSPTINFGFYLFYELQANIKAVKQNEIYTFSFYAKSASEYKLRTGVPENQQFISGWDGVLQDTWAQYTITFRRVTSGIRIIFLFYSSDQEKEKSYDVSVSSPKLELGTVTDPIWTPAPEDLAMKSDLEALTARVAALEAVGK